MSRRIPDTLLPNGIHDERNRAVLRTLSAEMETTEVKATLITDPYTVDAKLLPFLVMEHSLEEYLTPGINEMSIRRLIDFAPEIHAQKGLISGVRKALSAINVSLTWIQWWETEPKGHHNTHLVGAFFDEPFLEGGQIGDERHRQAVSRIVDATKRWSQDIAISFGIRSKVESYLGVLASSGGRYVAALPGDDPTLHPSTQYTGAASLFGGTHQAGMEIN